MTNEQRDTLECLYLTMLMKRDAAAWHRAMYFDDSGPPPGALEPEQRRIMRQLRGRVFHQKREEDDAEG
jgi:hypothetical protein